VENKKLAVFIGFMVSESYEKKSPAGSNRLPVQGCIRSRMAALNGSQNPYAATSRKEKMASDKKETTEW
jgi:hypothetical protein